MITLFNLSFFAVETVHAAQSNGIKVSSLITDAGPVVKFVLLILILMSVISWAIIFTKVIVMRRATKKSDKFLDLYHTSGNFGNLYSSTKHVGGPIAELFRSGYGEVMKTRRARSSVENRHPDSQIIPENVINELGVVELVERALNKTMSSEVSKLEGSLTFLATTGTTAPFIGLFGTVWGIMTSFIGLTGSEGIPTLQAVAPGIAEALIATAFGLAAAIPAVVAYNYFLSRVKKIDVEMENFSAEFLNIVERYLKKA